MDFLTCNSRYVMGAKISLDRFVKLAYTRTLTFNTISPMRRLQNVELAIIERGLQEHEVPAVRNYYPPRVAGDIIRQEDMRKRFRARTAAATLDTRN